MNSKKSSSKLPKPKPTLPKREPYKFLTRNLKVSHTNSQAFQKIQIKRLYLRKLFDYRNYNGNTEETIYSSFKKNKLFKTLKVIETSFLSRSYAHEALKNSKNLKSFFIEVSFGDLDLRKLAFYIRKLPSEVRKIRLQIDNEINDILNKDIYKIAKSIRVLKKLEYFKRWLALEKDARHVTKELKTYSDTASRLKLLNQMIYDVGNNEQAGFQRAMRRGIMYPGITGLKIYLSPARFKTMGRMDRYLKEENSQVSEALFDFENLSEDEELLYRMVQNDIRIDDEKEKDDLEGVFVNPRLSTNPEEDEEESSFDINRDTYMQITMREEIRPFYRFDLFPDLKKLTIIQEEVLYPFGSFVVDGFAALKKLEELKIVIWSRSAGSTYIFKGLLKLPLLKKFDLEISFLYNEDWALMEQFLKNQNNLHSLRIEIFDETYNKARYLEQNIYIESIIQSLNDKPWLRSLDIGCPFWSLETLSKGFSHLKMKNQLHKLEIQASDENITTNTKTWKRVEGLCNFIKNQKESLKELNIDLPLVLEETTMTHIAEAVSRVTSLRKLWLYFNSSSAHQFEDLEEYFEDILQRGIPYKSRKDLKFSKTWNPSLAKYLKRLENLESFLLNFDIIHKDSTRWFLDVVKALPSLERLKDLNLITKSGLELYRYEQKIIEAMFQLKAIKNISATFFSYNDPSRDFIQDLQDTIKEINQKQALRCDLMF